MIRKFICTAVFLATVAAGASAEPLKLAPKYNDTGTNPNGSKYSGTADVSVISDTTFSIVWHIGGDTYKGFGMRMNDSLAATYMINGEPGLVITKSTIKACCGACGRFVARTAPDRMS
jgi:hypothetical protein